MRAPLSASQLVQRSHALSDEQHFARQVGVMGTGLSAGGDQMAAVTGVGTDTSGDGGGRSGQSLQGGLVEGVGHHQAPRAGWCAQFGLQRLEFRSRPAAQGDPGAGRGGGGQVVGRQPADETGRPEEAEVVLPLGHPARLDATIMTPDRNCACSPLTGDFVSRRTSAHPFRLPPQPTP